MYKLRERHVEEALSTGLLGMPDVAWSFVQRIQIGTPVFLYDEDKKAGPFTRSPGLLSLWRLVFLCRSYKMQNMQ